MGRRAGEEALLEKAREEVGAEEVLREATVDAFAGARVEAREAISLAFVAALQLLPPRQRDVLVLRDVLGFRAKQVAAMPGGRLPTAQSGGQSASTQSKAQRCHLEGKSWT